MAALALHASLEFTQPRPLPPMSRSCSPAWSNTITVNIVKQISNIIFNHFTREYTPVSFKPFEKTHNHNTIIASDTMNNLPIQPNIQSLFHFLCQKYLCTGGSSESGSKQGLHIARKSLLDCNSSPTFFLNSSSFLKPITCPADVPTFWDCILRSSFYTWSPVDPSPPFPCKLLLDWGAGQSQSHCVAKAPPRQWSPLPPAGQARWQPPQLVQCEDTRRVSCDRPGSHRKVPFSSPTHCFQQPCVGDCCPAPQLHRKR